MFWLYAALIVIIGLLIAIYEKLDNMDPTKSHAEWTDGKWNKRP